VKIGAIDIEKPILLAPMEDVTDLSFRIICKRLGADIVYTEFVNAEGLIRDSRKTKAKMHFLDEERPITPNRSHRISLILIADAGSRMWPATVREQGCSKTCRRWNRLLRRWSKR
jgi:tRNA-dihydrouridine synthase